MYFSTVVKLYVLQITHLHQNEYIKTLSVHPYRLRQILFCQKGEHWNGVLTGLPVSAFLIFTRETGFSELSGLTPVIHTLVSEGSSHRITKIVLEPQFLSSPHT